MADLFSNIFGATMKQPSLVWMPFRVVQIHGLLFSHVLGIQQWILNPFYFHYLMILIKILFGPSPLYCCVTGWIWRRHRRFKKGFSHHCTPCFLHLRVHNDKHSHLAWDTILLVVRKLQENTIYFYRVVLKHLNIC